MSKRSPRFSKPFQHLIENRDQSRQDGGFKTRAHQARHPARENDLNEVKKEKLKKGKLTVL